MPAYRFLGGNPPAEFHESIPARDMSADEVAALSDDQQATVKASRLYEAVKPEPNAVAELADHPSEDVPTSAHDAATASSRGRSAEPKLTAPSS